MAPQPNPIRRFRDCDKTSPANRQLVWDGHHCSNLQLLYRRRTHCHLRPLSRIVRRSTVSQRHRGTWQPALFGRILEQFSLHAPNTYRDRQQSPSIEDIFLPEKRVNQIAEEINAPIDILIGKSLALDSLTAWLLQLPQVKLALSFKKDALRS